MVIEFVIWLILTVAASRILQSTFSLSQTVSLLIAALVCALAVALVMFMLNSQFRKKAVKTSAHVDKILPPQRSGGLAQVEISIHSGSRVICATITPEVTPEAGSDICVWVSGRRVLPSLPTPASDFRILAVCLVIAALVLLGYLCTLLLPDPTKA